MSIVSWVLVGTIVGLVAALLRPGRLPGGTPGAAVTAAIGGFIGGGVFAALDDRTVQGFDLVTAASAAVGAVVMLAAVRKADYAEPRRD